MRARKKIAIARRSRLAFSYGRDNFRGASLARHAKPHRYPRRIQAWRQQRCEIARRPAEQHQALKRFHRRYRRVRSMAVQRRIASRFWSPVSFALRTLTLRWECTKRRIARKYASKTRGSAGMLRNGYRYFLVRAQVTFASRTLAQTRIRSTRLAQDYVRELKQGGQASNCCASMSLLKAMRRSRATAAK
jgi:hypothetical protein